MYIDKKKALIIGGCVLAAALITVGIILLVKSVKNKEVNTELSGGIDARRQNILRLASSYAEAGEYDRALNLIDGLLIENHEDDEARALQMAILNMDRSSRSGDTDALIEAQRQFLEEQRRQNAMLASNQAALNQAALSQQRTSDARADAEAEAAAARRAEAAAEEARKKAQEEEMARASRETQEQMRKVNNLVADGKARLAAGDYSGAGQLFSDARRAMPSGESRFESQTLSTMADAYYDYNANNPGGTHSRDAVNRASDLAGEAVAKDATQALPHHILGKIARDANQTDRSLSEFREAARLDPNNFMYAHDLGRVLFIARRYQEARDAFQNAVRLNPDFEPGWYNLGGTYRALNRLDDALAAYRQAIAIKSDYFAAHREVGRILVAKNDARGAVDAFSRALQHNPNDYNTLCELGAAFSQAGNNIEAESTFNRALRINSADAQTNYNMALVKLELKKYNEAINHARIAVDASPNNAIYVYTLGLACEQSGAVEVAVNAYQRAASLDVKYLRPRINLGSIYLAGGNLGEAIRYLNEAYASEPANFEVNNNLGAVYAKQENWSYSIVHYERALNSRPNDPTVRFNLARAYAGAGDLDKAQGAYQALLRLAPDNWDAMLELGKTCVMLGQNNEAKRYLQDLINRNPNYSNKAEAESILRSL
uniref:TPR domain protein n=1 Tax=uncultured bacterium contig00078 TaxID=1181556 RepID=A0A806KH00_9BACT|nr:TPR domain protein [uncultured bacterium contig00078]